MIKWNWIVLLKRIADWYVYFCLRWNNTEYYKLVLWFLFLLVRNSYIMFCFWRESCIVDSRKCEFLQWYLFASAETVKSLLVFRKFLADLHFSVFREVDGNTLSPISSGTLSFMYIFPPTDAQFEDIANCIAQKSFVLLPIYFFQATYTVYKVSQEVFWRLHQI